MFYGLGAKSVAAATSQNTCPVNLVGVRRSKDQENPGPVFPGYRQISEIGGGGFSTVFRATEESTGRFVALKVLRVAGRAPQVLEAFDREVRALGALSSHPNIVTLYRTLTTPDGRPVLVMELCRGSMAQRIRAEGPLAPREAVAVGIKIAGALETAHRSGLLHRDMKPQNVLITNYGEPALADFGVAALQASAQATEGIFGFTTLHAPPEVLEGQHLSPATDVYGLASTLYQLLAGHAPFAAYEGEAPASVILRILRDPVTPLRASAAVPVSLSDLLTAALSKDPRGRPVSALALAEDLQRVETVEGWPTTPLAVWGQATLPQQSPPPPAMGAAVMPPGRAQAAAAETTTLVGPPKVAPARPQGLPRPAPTPAPAATPAVTPAPAATPAPAPAPARAFQPPVAIPPSRPSPAEVPPPLTHDRAQRGPGVVAPATAGRRVLPAQPAELLALPPLSPQRPPAPPTPGTPAPAPAAPAQRPRYVDPPTVPPAAPAPGTLAARPSGANGASVGIGQRPTLLRPAVSPGSPPGGVGGPRPEAPAAAPATPLSPTPRTDARPWEGAPRWSAGQAPLRDRPDTYEETLAPAGLAAALHQRKADPASGTPAKPAASTTKALLAGAAGAAVIVAAVIALLLTGVI